VEVKSRDGARNNINASNSRDINHNTSNNSNGNNNRIPITEGTEATVDSVPALPCNSRVAGKSRANKVMEPTAAGTPAPAGMLETAGVQIIHVFSRKLMEKLLKLPLLSD
jgi:hypothetical protein